MMRTILRKCAGRHVVFDRSELGWGYSVCPPEGPRRFSRFSVGHFATFRLAKRNCRHTIRMYSP